MAKKKDKKIKTKSVSKRKEKKIVDKQSRLISFRDFLIDNFFWIVGSISYSAAITLFAVPNQIAQSGISGVAIIVNYIFDTPIGITNFVLNIPLLVLAFIFIGRKFTAKTLWVTAIMSVILDLMTQLIEDNVISVYKGDALLASIFCGALSGFGLAMILMRGATSGGTDIIGKLLRLIWPHLSIGKVILLADAVIVLAAAVVFKSVESALYAAIVIFISSQVLDRILYGTGNGKMIYIFTKKGKEIAREIIDKASRGVSIIPVEGGYTGEERDMVLCTSRNSELAKIIKIVKKCDPETFIVVAEAREILGKGFKPPASQDGNS